MRMIDLIEKKKRKQELTKEEIEFFIQGYVKNKIPDYQVSALLMAIYFNGLTKRELFELTKIMASSGDKIDLGEIKGITVDKHSTGGVGDKVSLVVGPLAAACGLKFTKMAGRGLGHTGGTIDKLESIKGLNTSMSEKKFISQVNKIGCGIISQTKKVACADKKLYALRDVTATVDSLPLIAASIMSKKLAINSDAIVLEVTAGNGAFMKKLSDAKRLAKLMVDIGKFAKRNLCAIISDMNQPLGYAIGNSLEVIEAMATLQGAGPKDLEELCIEIVANMLVLSEKERSIFFARKKVRNVLLGGKGFDIFMKMVSMQGGKIKMGLPVFKSAKKIILIPSEKEGYVTGFDTEKLGYCAMKLGCGREKKSDKIDHSVGILLKKKIGDHVKIGDPFCVVHVNQVNDSVRQILCEISSCLVIGKKKSGPKLIYEIIK